MLIRKTYQSILNECKKKTVLNILPPGVTAPVSFYSHVHNLVALLYLSYLLFYKRLFHLHCINCFSCLICFMKEKRTCPGDIAQNAASYLGVHCSMLGTKGIYGSYSLTLYTLGNPKRILCQTVKTQMKCHITAKCAAFHQCLHCLIRQKQSSEKEVQFYLEIITSDPSIYTIDHPKSNSMKPEGNIH